MQHAESAGRELPARSSRHDRARLIRHDRRVAINTTRATFGSWHDRLIAATMLLFALAVLRSWFAELSWWIASSAAAGMGAGIGVSVGRAIASRLDFHRSDGLLAADALTSPESRRYVMFCHGIGLAVLAALALVARPSLLPIGVPGYVMGALVSHGSGAVARHGSTFGGAKWAKSLRRRLQHPIAGLVAAMVLALSLLLAESLARNVQLALAGLETLLLALALITVDHDMVRFMAIAGRGPWRISLRHARGGLVFAGVAVPAAWLAWGPLMAGVVAVTSFVISLLTILRVLAYHLHGKRFADLLVSMAAAILLVTAYAMPIVLPVVAIAVIWRFGRRAAARTWLLT